MKKTRIRFFKFSGGKQNLQFHWPNMHEFFKDLKIARVRRTSAI
jgi:hypothetical protein